MNCNGICKKAEKIYFSNCLCNDCQFVREFAGILTPQEGLSGFNNPATVTGMFILSEGVRRTGILNVAGDFFSTRMQESFNYWFLALLIFVGVISAFINNTAAVAIFIPIIWPF